MPNTNDDLKGSCIRSVSPAKRALIDAARVSGYKITSKQIDRWRFEKLLPEPDLESRGRGGGIARVAADDTIPQLLGLCRLLEEVRSFDRAAFYLWIDNFDVPLVRVREALKRMATIEIAKLKAMPEEQRASVLAHEEMQVAEHRGATKGVRKYARAGKLVPFVEAAIDVTTGSDDPTQWSESRQEKFARGFEEMSGLDRARVGAPEIGVKPWLHVDSSKLVTEALALSRGYHQAIDSSSDEQLERARRIFGCIKPLRQLVAHAKSQWGHSFGLENLVDGFGAKRADVLLFQAFLVLGNAKPELENVVRMMESDALKTLTQIEAGLTTQNQQDIATQ